MKLLGRAGFCGFATCTYGPIIYSRTHDDVFDGRVNIYFELATFRLIRHVVLQ